MLLAVDPGTTMTAFVILDADGNIVEKGKHTNEWLLSHLWTLRSSIDMVAIEKVASYGMAVGEDIFQTVWWSGRFHEALDDSATVIVRPTRKEVVVHLCGSPKAKDSNVRQRIIDLYGGPEAIKKGGRLYGIAKDMWAALAVALYAMDTQEVSQ